MYKNILVFLCVVSLRLASCMNEHSVKGTNKKLKNQALFVTGRRVCTHTKETYKYVPVERSLCIPKFITFLRPCTDRFGKKTEGMCHGYRTKYTTVKRRFMEKRKTAKIEYTCCPGWKKSPHKSGCLEPDCEGDCNHQGVCTGPNKCSCSPGWTGEKCNVDINECSKDNGKCQHKCVNYEGTFKCQCNPGYVLQKDGRSCEFCIKCSKEYKDLEERLSDVEKAANSLEEDNKTFAKQLVNISSFQNKQREYLEKIPLVYDEFQSKQSIISQKDQQTNQQLQPAKNLLFQQQSNQQNPLPQYSNQAENSLNDNSPIKQEQQIKNSQTVEVNIKEKNDNNRQDKMMMNKAKEFMGQSPETLEVFLKLIEKLDMLEKRINSCGCDGGEAHYQYYS